MCQVFFLRNKLLLYQIYFSVLPKIIFNQIQLVHSEVSKYTYENNNDDLQNITLDEEQKIYYMNNIGNCN